MVETRLPFTKNALTILEKRYLRQGDNGPIETPEEMYKRIATTIANVEKEYGATEEEINKLSKQFYEILTRFEFTPAGRTITNAGAETPVVANCIVLHPKDSMKGIFDTLSEAAQLQQLGSGLGFPFHLLRPAGFKAKRSGGIASGPVSFLKVYDKAFGVIKQQGRHGANMAVMSINHPDCLEFIHAKEKEGTIKNFNISVGLTDEFMKSVETNSQEKWLCEWNGKKTKPRKITRDQYDTIIKIEEIDITAKELFEEIMDCAWKNGEPGCVLLDNANKFNQAPGLGPLEATNPCGEIFLHDGDVCNLGSINLGKFVKNNEIEWERLEKTITLATTILDNTIDLYDFPIKRVQEMATNNRRLGLGVMGWADMLYELKIPYNSNEAIELAKKIMGRINYIAHRTSEYTAIRKGNFPNHEKSIYTKPMRNVACTAVAPTGSISMLFDASSGIEPIFALSYYKGQVMGDNTLYYTNPLLEKILKEKEIYSEELMKKIAETGSIQHIKEIPEDIKKVFVVAHDISPEWHMKMQSAFQENVDNAISKTINFPNTATKEDIKKAYLTAWKLGCKGMTVYRDGSRNIEVLSVNNPKEKEKCNSCGSVLRIEEGCANCPSCGMSMCKI